MKGVKGKKKPRTMAQIIRDTKKYGHTNATAEEMTLFWNKVARLTNGPLSESRRERLESYSKLGNLILI